MNDGIRNHLVWEEDYPPAEEAVEVWEALVVVAAAVVDDAVAAADGDVAFVDVGGSAAVDEQVVDELVAAAAAVAVVHVKVAEVEVYAALAPHYCYGLEVGLATNWPVAKQPYHFETVDGAYPDACLGGYLGAELDGWLAEYP